MKKILAALMVLVMIGTAMAADDPNDVAVGGEMNSVIETTYPSNSWTYTQQIGNASGMDDYRWYYEDFCWTHTYTPTAGTYIMSVNLTIRAHDVDWFGGERDHITVDGVPVGDLQGSNEAWSETTFSVPVSALDDGTAEVCIDIGPSGWAVEIDWSQIDVEYDTAVSTPEPALAIGLLSILVPGMIYVIRKR